MRAMNTVRSVPPREDPASLDKQIRTNRLTRVFAKEDIMRLGIAVLTVMALASPAVAQHQHGQAPYAGMQDRALKALSDQQLADLRAGRGMSLALAGELNGYPGPSHVLELADQLQLNDEQRE